MVIGHSVFHWITQSFVVVLPEIQQAFQLSGVGVGGILAARELASGLVTLPGGVAVDVLRRHWGSLLVACLVASALGSLVIGTSPAYSLLLVGMVIVAVATPSGICPPRRPLHTISGTGEGWGWPFTVSAAAWATLQVLSSPEPCWRS